MPESQVDTMVVRDILGYFSRHPHALDTLEGLARWRILEEQIHRNVEATHKALEWLVSAGFLVRRSSSSGPLFRLNTEELPRIQQFLESGPASTPLDSKEKD